MSYFSCSVYFPMATSTNIYPTKKGSIHGTGKSPRMIFPLTPSWKSGHFPIAMFDGLRIEYMYDTRHRTVRIKLEKDSPRTEYQRISKTCSWLWWCIWWCDDFYIFLLHWKIRKWLWWCIWWCDDFYHTFDFPVFLSGFCSVGDHVSICTSFPGLELQDGAP
jgi:hypothetical protein